MTTCRQMVVLVVKGMKLFVEDYPKYPIEMEYMTRVPYANVVDNLMYVMVCARPKLPKKWESLVGLWLILDGCTGMQ